MPKSITYRPVLIDELITNERLNSYVSVFQHSNDVELVGAYLWNANVCSAMYPLLTAAEVTLRNSIDTALTRDLGRYWWKGSKLHYKSFQPTTPKAPPPFAVKAIRDNFSNAAKKVKSDKKSRYGIASATATHHEIIAKTEFSTWEFILDPEFTGNSMIWPKNLGKVFRGKWPTSKASQLLTSSKDLVKTVREFRNRVSHHEPVWKRYGVCDETDAISHLHEKIDKIKQLISIVSPEKEQLIVNSGLFRRAERLCSKSELRRCQQIADKNNVKSITKLSRIAQKGAEENSAQIITIYKNGKIQFLLEPL